MNHGDVCAVCSAFFLFLVSSVRFVSQWWPSPLCRRLAFQSTPNQTNIRLNVVCCSMALVENVSNKEFARVIFKMFLMRFGFSVVRYSLEFDDGMTRKHLRVECER